MSSIDTKELKESLGFGLVFATLKAAFDYVSNGKKPAITSSGKNGAVGAAADVVYDYGKKQKWWPWM